MSVGGTVAPRLPGTENTKLPTGAIELQATDVEILSEAKTPPFYINDPDATVDEIVRLRYRYLDIRREAMQRRLMLRSRMVQAIREVHHANGFVEVETPTLIKSTPEGARDFIVPSRLQPGTVYALPQSPQQLKQLLMVGGMDRYMQIARCYRDEDLRGDRQPEFTQLDLEMSFVDEAAVMAFVERMAIEVSRSTVPDRPILQTPFPILTYDEALERYGTDKPDIRFALELVDLGPALVDGAGAPASGFGVFDSTLAAGGRVRAIVAPGMAGITRREIDELTERARRFGAKGLAYLALEPGGEIKSPIAKFLGDETKRAIIERSGAGEGDLILVVADTHEVCSDVLGRLRAELGERLGLADPDVLAYVWIHRFPMYQWDAEQRPLARHPQPVQWRPAGGRGAPRRRRRATPPGRTRPIRPVAPTRSSTTSRSMAGNSAADRSGSTGATSSSDRSCCRVIRSRPCRRSSVPCSTPSSTARRRTAGSRSGSTAGRRCSPIRPISARSWPSRRRSPAPIRCSTRRRSRRLASTRNSDCATSGSRRRRPGVMTEPRPHHAGDPSS